MATELGVDYDMSMFQPPATEAEYVLATLRCGHMFLMSYTYADGWPRDDELTGGLSKREARKASAQVRSALQSRDGMDAVAVMAVNYGRAYAELSRRAAEDPEYADRRDSLVATAMNSDALAICVEAAWAVTDDYYGARAQVAEAETGRLYDPDNPDALVDLRAYAMRTRAVIEPVAMCLGERLQEFNGILGPLYHLHMAHSVATLSDWNYVGEFWVNLLRAEPIAWHEVIEAQEPVK